MVQYKEYDFRREEIALIKTDIELPIGYGMTDIISALSQKLTLLPGEAESAELQKRSLILSDKNNIRYKATVSLSLDPERERRLLLARKLVSRFASEPLVIPESRLTARPLVVGAGPAGLFAALTLALAGAKPIVIERGEDVVRRALSVCAYSSGGVLDPESNIQFGEGGAGAFSDGKLKVGSKDKYKEFILQSLVDLGAPEEILYSTTAHVGTDKLPAAVKSLREKIISLGGEVYFGTKLTEILMENGRTIGAKAIREGREELFETDTLILATGHSARDTVKYLHSLGVPMEARGFGIGVRIEHPREYINRLVYGDNYPVGIETASYHLVTHLPNGRSVYSFCMCPGGTVVAASSDRGSIVTNGMSAYARDADNSNAALLVSVTPEDFPTEGPLGGIILQEKLERLAYEAAGSAKAPATRLDAFLEHRHSTAFTDTKPSYPIGTSDISPDSVLPDYITDSLRIGIADFDEWLPGFGYPSAVLTAPETRTTSPVRILRGADYSVPGFSGLYPIGEGAGYAGGIISSARDGVVVAESILRSRYT